MFHCMDSPHLIYPCINEWIFQMCPTFDSYEQHWRLVCRFLYGWILSLLWLNNQKWSCWVIHSCHIEASKERPDCFLEWLNHFIFLSVVYEACYMYIFSQYLSGQWLKKKKVWHPSAKTRLVVSFEVRLFKLVFNSIFLWKAKTLLQSAGDSARSGLAKARSQKVHQLLLGRHPSTWLPSTAFPGILMEELGQRQSAGTWLALQYRMLVSQGTI